MSERVSQRRYPPARHAAPPRRRRRRSRLAGFLHARAVHGRLPAFLLAVGLSVLGRGFLFSDDFVVRSVVVQGNALAFADSIVATSGALGQPVFRLDTEEVARRVAAHPAVASAEVRTEFPDRVVVRVQERVPVLAWQAGEQAVLVDQQGWVIALGFDPNLPRVVQTEGDLPRVGAQISPELIQAIQVVQERLGERLTMVAYEPRLGLTAHLTEGRTVVLGGSDRLPLKLNVLDAALSLPDHWSQLDLREPERPYYQ